MRGPIRARFVRELELAVTGRSWPFAEAEARAIAEHWQRRVAEKPEFFNGAVHMIRSLEVADDRCRAGLIATDFRSFLHWKESGFRDAGVLGGGAGVALRSREGHLLVGEASARTLGAGRIYLVSGILDDGEVGPDGRLDLAALALRELEEETGLTAGEVEVRPGFWVVEDRMWVAFVIEAVSPLPAGELRRRILANVARQAEPEIADVHIIERPDQIDEARMLGHTKILIRELLG